jgi:Fe-S-cluster containining protein
MTPPQPETVTANFRLGWEGRTLEAAVPVPTGPARPRVLLPVIQQLTNALVGMGESLVAGRGETISCKAGCGACCRQLVPVSETEARHLRDLVEVMPEPRRAAVKARFADALKRVAGAGLLDPLERRAEGAVTSAVGLDYFRLGIPCPFLEDESCSIHPDRPLSCREYLVTSPAEHCTAPTRDNIRRVPTPGFAMSAFATLDGPQPGGKGVRWVPLVLALEWAGANPEPPAAETGPDLFARFMRVLTKVTRVIPGPEEVAT